jgi:RNA polymerase sigma-70 factor (ECF subfamily)
MALPKDYRIVVYLYYYEEYSTKDIAKLLRVSQSTVTTRLHRARQQLRERLKEELQ